MARNKHTSPTQRPWTTFEVANHLGVSLQTVVNWVKAGRLQCHKTPGGHRRIAHNDLVAFARDNDYPLDRTLMELGSSKQKVLVVDDERDFADLVREYLVVRGGLEVEIADSGFHAGFTVARFKPDLILMDLMMPDMDGFEVYRTLQADPDTRHIPVIACTAYRDAEIDRKVRQERFDGLVEKPIKLEALLELVVGRLGGNVDKTGPT